MKFKESLLSGDHIKDKVVDQILLGSQEGQKFYEFDEDHDDNRPADLWFQKSHEGLILFVVFYTQACRWSRCLGCNLPSTCSVEHVDFQAIMNQISFLFRCPEVLAERYDIKKIIVSNNGSVLDEATFSTTALMYLIAKLNKYLSNLSTLSLETRPEYVDPVELEMLKRALSEGRTTTQLELAVGFEAYDPAIRNDHFDKGLDFDKFENFIKLVRPFGYHIKCYFMQKPVPDMTDEQAVEDVRKGIEYLTEISRSHQIEISMHLNPTYAASGTILAEKFTAGKYSPPRLLDVAKAILSAGRFPESERINIFVGLNDEGLAVEGGSFIREGDEPLIRAIENFNVTQDYDRLAQDLDP